MTEASPLPVKVVMLGSTRVGKTTLVIRWTQERYESNQAPTVGAAFQVVSLEMPDGKTYDMHIWDTAGQDQFRSTTSVYCRDAKAAMLVFDICEKQTFLDIPQWIDTLHEKVNAPFILIGNKNDMDDQRQVSFDEASQFANQHNALYFETSALTGYNVDDAFNELANLAVRGDTEVNQPTTESVPQTQAQTVDIKEPENQNASKKSSGCC